MLQYIAGTTAIQALVASSREILVVNQCAAIALEGADTVYVASTAPRFIFQLYGAAGIKTVADLKGQVVAATQPAASPTTPMGLLLRRYNLAPDKDVKIVYAGSRPVMLSLVKAGNAWPR